jgi:hypothetical protein
MNLYSNQTMLSTGSGGWLTRAQSVYFSVDTHNIWFVHVSYFDLTASMV